MLAQLWLPILLSTVFVFIASALINMLLKFWHAPDYRGFANEDEIAAAIRKGGAAAPAKYVIPYCTDPKQMQEPAMQEEFKQGPIAHVNLVATGPMSMGPMLGKWFVFCLLVSLACAGIAAHALPPHPDMHVVFHTIGVAALLGYSFGEIPNSIWRGQPRIMSAKYFIDGIVYAVITAATFCWLWPAA